MNPLQENANLFANGKFKVSIEYYTKIEGDIWPLTGVVDGILFLEKYNGCKLENCQLDPNDCTLIARPIEDMTEQEISDYSNVNAEGAHAKQIRYAIEHLVNTQNISFHDARKLLSIGVLPFPQELFEDGTVIDATGIE